MRTLRQRTLIDDDVRRERPVVVGVHTGISISAASTAAA
jgi:hypothetical protein